MRRPFKRPAFLIVTIHGNKNYFGRFHVSNLGNIYFKQNIGTACLKNLFSIFYHKNVKKGGLFPVKDKRTPPPSTSKMNKIIFSFK